MTRFTTRVWLLAVSAGFLSAGGVAAEKSVWQVGVHAVAANPRGEFEQSIPETRWGGLGYFTRRLGESPLRLGAEVGGVTNGSIGIEVDRGRFGFGFDEARLSNDMLFGHFLVRVQPVFGRISPFVEGALGARAFENSIFFVRCIGNCTVPTGTSNVAFSAGGGAGISVRVRDDGNEAGISVEARLRYLAGGTTEYFLESDLPELVNESPVPTRSRTDLVMITFGLVFDF